MIVLLYILDGLRPDHLSCYGFDKTTSPNIDKIARDGVLYTNAYAPSNWSKVSGASIFTSQYPRTLGQTYLLDILPNYPRSLQNLLRQAGFKCYAVSTNAFFSSDFGFSGFDEFVVLLKDKQLWEESPTTSTNPKILEMIGTPSCAIVPSEMINRKILPVIVKGQHRNMFITAWSVDTHAPFFVRHQESYFGNSLSDFIAEQDAKHYPPRKVQALYHDMIYYNDLQIGELVSTLREAGVYEEALLIIVGDHGVSFGEHGQHGHGGNASVLYQEQIKVPLIIKFPGKSYKDQRCDALTQLADIYPTVLDICRISFESEAIEGGTFIP